MSMKHIDHVVVLMQENNSFDRVLGWMTPEEHGVDGIGPGFSNPISGPLYAAGERIFAEPGANMIPPGAPHQFLDMWAQLWPRGGVANEGYASVQADYARKRTRTPEAAAELVREVMRYHHKDDLPVTRDLALNFAVADRWFASIASNTWPNRYFLHMGTSPTGALPLPQIGRRPTIFGRLSEAGLDWRIYVDGPACIYTSGAVLGEITRTAKARRRRGVSPEEASPLRAYDRFACDVSRARPLTDDPAQLAHLAACGIDTTPVPLPAYTFIEPRHLNVGTRQSNNDHHGKHKVWGQRLLADLYNTLRADEAVWRRTLLIVLYDENGGYYDHVPAPDAPHPRSARPSGILRPGSMERYGGRVPALLISPWIRRGAYSQVCDHTSVLAFLEHRFGLAPLSRRDALADSLADALCDTYTPGPARLEPPPPPAEVGVHLAGEATSELEYDLQRHLATLDGADGDAELATLTEHELSRRAEGRAERLRRGLLV
ncbi:MAG: alkaline phosphatase family protein [Myxococcota bacterium]